MEIKIYSEEERQQDQGLIDLSKGFKMTENEIQERKDILLRAAYNILKKCTGSVYLENVLAVTDFWDGVECDGYCLMDDIAALLEID